MKLITKLSFVLLYGSLFIAQIVGEKKASHIKIGSFNIQIFGVKKAANPDVMKYIVKIIQRYDLILIQEIRDKSLTAIYRLGSLLKEAKTPYRIYISKRLGRTSSKEQYAFLERIGSGIKFEDSFTYDDGSEANGTDTFQREPYVLRFSFQGISVKYISFIAIHVDPDTAAAELRHLSDVYEYTLKKWGSKDVIIMGDFNADCSYLPKKMWPTIPLRQDKYYWPISDDADTTVSKSDCAYDRFIIAGDRLIELAKSGQTYVFRFDDAFGLNNTMAKLISDHYPIELNLPITETNEIPSSASKSARRKAMLNELLSSECGREALKKANLSAKDFKNLTGNSEDDYIDSINNT